MAGPSEGLPAQCKGGCRVEPSIREVCPGVLRASRPGEAVIANDLLGREVKRWFQQLRGLQSLKHALSVGKQTDMARQYRSQLWQPILTAKGFTPSFASWWPRRVVRLHGAPQELHETPSAAQAATIYDDFHSNYRKLESWHVRRRGSVLQSKYAESSSVLFSALRPAKPPVLETLVRHQAYEILAVDVVSNQLQLDGIPSGRGKRELGGYLLAPLWPALRRSRAPARQKWAAVTTKFWPMVFHGAASCWLSDTAVDKLRAKMAWALGWTCAGAGPDLRALTEGPMELDPAFFQIWTCVRDFQRLASKSRTLQQLWVEFMGDLQGRSLAGPFSTLLHHAEALNWGFMEPPQVTDH